MKYIFVFIFLSNACFATTFTYISSKSNTDFRQHYGAELLKLSLEKTVVTHGAYVLEFSPKMNKKRALATIDTTELENFFFKHSVSAQALQDYGYVNFPVDLGIVGYRVFFVSPQIAKSFHKVTTLEALKNYSIVQGPGWLDISILKQNGFNVIVGSNYEGLFKMVARGRVDLFLRGANELWREYNDRKDELSLMADTSIILYYPLPRFFITSKKNKQAIERVQTGMMMAYRDGSLLKLWKKYYRESVSYIDFSNAKIFRIDNPFLKGIDESYKEFIIAPEQLINP